MGMVNLILETFLNCLEQVEEETSVTKFKNIYILLL